jgi:hypothetical protein
LSVGNCTDKSCNSECAAIKAEEKYYESNDCGGGGSGGGGGAGGGGTTSTSKACSWGSDVCPDGQYCDAPGCDKGVCAPIFGKISGVREPVCGCDGVTYWNGTLAKNAAMSVRQDAQCDADEAQGCSSMLPCGKGQSCNLEGSVSICTNKNPQGSCWKLPLTCPGGVNDGLNMRDCEGLCRSECTLINDGATHYADISCPQLF